MIADSSRNKCSPPSLPSGKAEAYSSEVNRLLMPIKVTMAVVTSLLILIIAICLIKSFYHKLTRVITESVRRRRSRTSSSRSASGTADQFCRNVTTSLRQDEQLQRLNFYDSDVSGFSSQILFDPFNSNGHARSSSMITDPSRWLRRTSNTSQRNNTSINSIHEQDDENPPTYEQAMKQQNRYGPVTYLSKDSSTRLQNTHPSDLMNNNSNENNSNSFKNSLANQRGCSGHNSLTMEQKATSLNEESFPQRPLE